MNRKYNAVVFDLDDVLYPGARYMLGGFKAVADYMFNVYGRLLYEELAKRYCPGMAEKLLREAISGCFENLDRSFLERIMAVYWGHDPEICLYDDAKLCLALLRKMGVRTGVVTWGMGAPQKAKVKALGISHLVDVIVHSSDMLGKSRIVDAFRVAELELDVPFSQTLYVGNEANSPYGITEQLLRTNLCVERHDVERNQSVCRELPGVASLEYIPQYIRNDNQYKALDHEKHTAL